MISTHQPRISICPIKTALWMAALAAGGRRADLDTELMRAALQMIKDARVVERA